MSRQYTELEWLFVHKVGYLYDRKDLVILLELEPLLHALEATSPIYDVIIEVILVLETLLSMHELEWLWIKADVFASERSFYTITLAF